jgi:hypothetical protein
MIRARTKATNPPKKNLYPLPPGSAARKKIKASTPSPNYHQVTLIRLSHTHHQVQAQTAQTIKNQGLPPNGVGVRGVLPEERASKALGVELRVQKD